VTAFRQEAQMLAKLSHPNLPAVSDYFSEGGKQYLVMEFVDGDTLEDRLARTSGFLDEAQVVDWATQICDVLSYLHSQQPPVIFRDLKPSNIMVDRSGRVKLIDFGIARLFKPGKSGDTQVMGTPGYAAPEQYGKAQTDPRSDVYSLGVTLHRLLTKYDPADTPFNLPQTRSLNPKVSSGMAALIERATRTDATARYQSAREMQQALKAPPAPAPAKPQPAPAQVAVAPVATPVAPAAAAPPIATPAPARQAAAPASLSRSGLWGTLLISLFLGGVAGFASQALPSDLGVSIPSVGRLSLAAAILFAAAPLAAKLTRRPGAALLTAAAAGLLPLLLRGGLSGDLPALLQLVVPMGLATELIFLLGGYRHFGLVAMVLAALAGVAGEAVSLLLVYEFSPSLDFLLPLAVAAVVGGAVAWLIGRVFGR
jgi:serine/threonine-protein kinase